MATRLTRRTPWDAVWKEALTCMFRSTVELLFPEAAAEVDWSQPVEVLDKELRTLLKTWKKGRGKTGFVDHLVRVKLLTSEEESMLIHLEVQNSREARFEERIYLYHSWLTGVHGKLVATLAILGDPDPNWRPDRYEGRYAGGGKATLEFPIAKILDFEARLAELLQSDNPVALFVVACLKALQTPQNSDERFHWKLQLTELMLHKKWDEVTRVTLFQMMDAVIMLPERRQRAYTAQAAELQEKFEMKFITPTDQLALIDARRAGRQEGRQEGIEIGVRRGQLRELRESILEIAEARLGPCSSEWVERIQSIESIEMLTALRRQVLRAETWSEVSLP